MTRRQRDSDSTPIVERDTNQPPTADQQRLDALPYVARFTDGGIRQRVINYLYHLEPTPRLYHSFLLLLGGPYDAARIGRRFTATNYRADIHRLHQISDVQHQLKVLKTWAALPSGEHADQLLGFVGQYTLPGLSTDALRDLYINIGCKLSAWESISEADDNRAEFLTQFGGLQVGRLGVRHIVQHPGFARLAVRDREKLLWIAEYCAPSAYRHLVGLLDHGGSRLGGFPEISNAGHVRYILSPDFSGASSDDRLIDHLHELATSTSVPSQFLLIRTTLDTDVAGTANATLRELARSSIVSNLVRECHAPDAFVNQGTIGTCAITCVLNRLATTRPAEYARIAKELILRGSITFQWNANARSRWYDQHYATDPTLPPFARNRWNGFGSAATTITTPANWNVAASRSISERVLQQAFAQHINAAVGNVDATNQPNQAGLLFVDAAILGVNLLGAQRGFRLAVSVDDRDTSWGDQYNCRVQPPLDTWIADIRAALASDRVVVFVSFLWQPVVPVFPTSEQRCYDVYRDLNRWQHGDYHLVQVRAIGTHRRPDGTTEERVAFWNPWGAEHLHVLAERARAAARADGDVPIPGNVRDPGRRGAQPSRGAAGEAPGLQTVINESRGAGMMWTTIEELRRHCRGYMYFDPTT